MNHQQARADIAAQIALGNVESFCEGDDAIRHLSKLFIVRNTRRRAGESDAAYAVRVGSLLTDMLDAIGQVLVGANVKYVLADAAEQPLICRTREASLLAVSRQVQQDVLMGTRCGMNADQAAVRQAIAANQQEELLRELQAAHRIIRNTLGILSVSQKAVLAERNARDGVDGEGITRAHEREAVIKRAGGVA